MPTENHQKPQERRTPDQQGVAWTNFILNMIIGSSVTVDYVTETIYRVFFGSKSIRYLLQILEYLLLSRVIIRIVFHVIKILSAYFELNVKNYGQLLLSLHRGAHCAA